MSESYVYRDVTLELRHVVGRDLQVDRGQEHEEEEVEKVASKAFVTDATQEAGQQSALRTFPTLKLSVFETRLQCTHVRQHVACRVLCCACDTYAL